VLHVSGRAAARGRLVFRRDGSVTGRLGGRRVRVSAAGRSMAGAAQLARGRVVRVLERLGNWPPDVPASAPGSYRLLVAGDRE
jgi:hypothetical protein